MTSRRARRPKAPAEAELRARGSRFLAFVHPVADEKAIKGTLAQLEDRFPDATHVCFGWRLSEHQSRCADAGEPAGTAGAPILQALEAALLVEALAVVVRYYGGTKLGRGGLIRAYGDAVRAALRKLETEPVYVMKELLLEMDYRRYGALERLVRPPLVRLEETRFAAEVCARLLVEESLARQIEDQLSDLGIDFRRSH